MILIAVFITFLFVQSVPTLPNNARDILKELDNTISVRDKFQKEKESKILKLKSELKGTSNESESFNITSLIFNEYKFYQYDSAYVYARKLESIAKRTSKKSDIAISEFALLFCFKSVGFFNEATDIINNFNTEGVPDEPLVNYYLLCAETYQNLSSYVSGAADLASEYDRKKLDYYKLALDHSPEYWYEQNWMDLESKFIDHYTDSRAR